MGEPDSTTPDSTSIPPAQNVTNVSGGVNIDAQRVDVGGDVVGRDKLEAGGHIIHAEAGATVIIGASPDTVGQGLAALHELMQRSPVVRNAVIAFQTDFEAAHQQLNTVGDYKDLHDLLHKLQFHCYDPLVQEAPRFPQDDLALDNLTDCLLTLEGIVNELNQVATRPALPKRETTWIGDVSTAKIDLSSAIDKLDAQQLRRAMIRLKSLLTTQPSRINALLSQAASTLRLQSLTEALSRVSGNLNSLNLDADRVRQFQSGVEALSRLEHGLKVLVDNHDGWQEIEVELWRIDGSLAQDSSELEMSWPDLKSKVDALCHELNVEWATALGKDGEALAAALNENNPVKIKRCFRSYRRRASNRFFQVDVDLKSICGELRKIGTPLASVLGMIE